MGTGSLNAFQAILIRSQVWAPLFYTNRFYQGWNTIYSPLFRYLMTPHYQYKSKLLPAISKSLSMSPNYSSSPTSHSAPQAPPASACSLRGYFLCIKGFFKSDTSPSLIIHSKSIFRNQFKSSFLWKAFTNFPGYMGSSNKTGHGSNLTCITMLVVGVFISISSRTVHSSRAEAKCIYLQVPKAR